MNILNKPTATYEQCETWLQGKTTNQLAIDNLPLLWKAAVSNGIDPVVLIAQAMIETGFFKFGGVIDAVSTLNDGKTLTAIIECKTSSKPQDWRDGHIPTDYALQGALYCYLKGIDRIIFVCSFLTDMDYANPENFEVTEDNTIITIKKLDDMQALVNKYYN